MFLCPYTGTHEDNERIFPEHFKQAGNKGVLSSHFPLYVNYLDNSNINCGSGHFVFHWGNDIILVLGKN